MSTDQYDRDKEHSELNMIDWQEIIDATHNGIIAVNREGRIIAFNRTSAEIVGIQQNKALGVINNTGLLEVMKTGRAEHNQRMAIGKHVIVSNRSPIWRNNEIVGAVSIFQDISDFEQLSHQLDTVKEINKDLDAVIESVDDGIVIADSHGFIIRTNNAYQRMTGIIASEYVGKNIQDLLDQGYIKRTVSKLVIERKSRVTIVDIRNGKELLLTGNPVFNENGELVRVVTAIRDVTELSSLTEQLAESEQMKNWHCHELERLRSQQSFRKIITRNPELLQKLEMASHVAQVDSTVLILGESGVGKELFVQLIHRASKRAKHPLIKINCGAIPANLLESEFFGYEPGAFTGAIKEGKLGLFELAQGGTLFLDEIGELPLDLQVKILRVLQDKEINRIGGKKTISLDIRVVAATNRDLTDMVKNRLFRQDLYYRLNVVPILLPPLRRRKEDIFLLVAEFLDKFNRQYSFQKWIEPKGYAVFFGV